MSPLCEFNHANEKTEEIKVGKAAGWKNVFKEKFCYQWCIFLSKQCISYKKQIF